VTSGASSTYKVYAVDWMGNQSATPATLSLTIPTTSTDIRRTGVRPTGAYWGAAGEQIDVMSGNLNIALPLATAKARTGWGATFMLSYNSQIWRQDGANVWNLGADLGYGLGWRLQAGSIFPVIYNGVVQYLIFTDATGAEFRLEDDGGNQIFRSKEGLHLWMNWGSRTLYFPDGGQWNMGSVSAGFEPDAGTLYPTRMKDTNGNFLDITYMPGMGGSGANTSSRIQWIGDARTYGAHRFFYTSDPAPHLSQIGSTSGCDQVSGECYSFELTSTTLTSPWSSTGLGTVSLLTGVTTTGLNTKHQFGYTNGEMTQMTTPLGGTLTWGYGDSLTTPKYHEVTTRTISTGANLLTNTWKLSRNRSASPPTATVTDCGPSSATNCNAPIAYKVWGFATTGLPISYEEQGPGSTALNHTDYTWTSVPQGGGEPEPGGIYVSAVEATQYQGANKIRSKTTQIVDGYGNIRESDLYDYVKDNDAFGSPAKVYKYSYLHDTNATYATPYYIRNRMTTVKLTPAGGSESTLATNTYDNYSTVCGGATGMVLRTGTQNHDDAYGTSSTYRGNVTSRTSIGGTAKMRYEMTGVAVCTEDGAGRSVSSAPDQGTGYSLPGVLTPGGNSNLATTVTYAPSWQVTSVTGPNGAPGTTDYDAYGRPTKTKIPDGAETNYAYAYIGLGSPVATANSQTATIGTGTTARWKKTVLDGFGRVIRVSSGHGSTPPVTESQVDTEYAACACSPLGKLSRVSQPYKPNADGSLPTRYWTTYAYDGSGRTVSVTQPDTTSTTTTQYLTVYGSYTGNLVKTTDPAQKWKVQQSDALGNLIRVIEPNPAGGADLITNYTYNALGQLTDVSMPRSNGTQSRHFEYSGKDLTLARNPENGTVTYQYDADHHVTKRTDAAGQETRYTYDSYGRLTQVQHWAMSWNPQTNTNTFQEQGNQRVTYSYDTNPINGSYSQNAWGRLTAVQFQDEYYGNGFSYMYSYNQAGRVTAQHMNYDGQWDFDATYQWDNEGRMTQINYPDGGPVYKMQFDEMGRLGTMNQVTGGTESLFAQASYGVAGQLTSLSYDWLGADRMTEERRYDSFLHLTGVTTKHVSGTETMMLNEDYTYPAGQFSGRIASATDHIIGETVNYSYDALNRLSSAAATNGAWGQSFGYDGFGNLTDKTPTAGSAPSLHVTFDPATNRQNGVTYDANGLPAGMIYDVENRPISDNAGQNQYAYDHAGKRVLKRYYPAMVELYFYGLGGQKLETKVCHTGESGMTCDTRNFNTYFGGKLVKAAGKAVAVDRLGSVRGVWNATSAELMRYYPYGEERTSTADNREKFGTYTRDSATQDYADQRYYNVGSGRFNVPDPLGLNAAKLQDPSSWNRYAYTLGDPINHSDRTGLNPEDPCGPDWEADASLRGPCKDPCDPATYENGFVEVPAAVCFVFVAAVTDAAIAEPPRVITLRQIDACVLPSGTGLTPNTWTLAVQYQVLVDGQPVYGNSALNALGISISESGANRTGNIGEMNGTWCAPGGKCPTANRNSMDSSGRFWDILAGSGTADQTFMNNGQVIAVSFQGKAGTQTTLHNIYDSPQRNVSVGGGALIGNTSTRLCGRNGDPAPRL
jgi:RHS repeat-associated protein